MTINSVARNTVEPMTTGISLFLMAVTMKLPIPGKPKTIRKGPGGNLIAVQVRNTVIALRSEEARHLLVAPEPSSSPVSRE